MILLQKIRWYLRNLVNLFIACVRILIYCCIHPKKTSKLWFSLFSAVNEFYQYTHGRLYSFESTKTFSRIKEKKLFAKCNYFNSDPKVMRPVETQIMSILTAHLQPKNVFEIGTYNGFSSLHFASNTSDDAKIYTLDLPPDYGEDSNQKDNLSHYSYDDHLVVELSSKNADKRMFQNTAYQGKIVELFGDSMTFDFSPYYKKIDLVFIDGSHSYDYVKADTENAFRLLSENGVIIWHDFDYIIHRDVFKYLNSLVSRHRIYSIPNTRFAIYGPTL